MAFFKDGNQASFGSKRVQNNVLPRSGDWICHTCRNLNFSFRHFCHKQCCNAPRRPSITLAPLDAQVTNHPPQFNYGGVVIPPPPPPPPPPQFNYRGVAIMPPPPPQFNYAGVAIQPPTSPPPPPPPQFNYGGVAILPPKSPPPLYGMPIRIGPSIPHFGNPVPYIPCGSFGGIAYSTRPTINPCGYGFQGPPPRVTRLTTNNSASQKHRHSGPGILSEGNWICPKCMNVNFANRSKCNIKKCGATKPKGLSIPDGSWTCKKCGNINYHFRTKCNLKDCRVERSASALSQITSK